MGTYLLLILLLFRVATGAESCSREELFSRLNALLEKHYLWWDRIKDASWKDEKELMEQLRKIGDRWTSITRQEEDRLWYSSSRMVGLGIRWDNNGYVTKVFPGSPAEKHGIREGDLIVSIQDITDKNLWRKAIREVERGQPIRVELIRDGLFLSLQVEKGDFVVSPIEEVRIIRQGDKELGYIKLTNFTQPALQGFREAMENFKTRGVDVLLIDLRDNGG
ncbi:MAG: PDZ domain-containing protein, partial [Aquificaceae bacterium]|nr:PDZ domain-containing protein [Aquificaceae bacterium]